MSNADTLARTAIIHVRVTSNLKDLLRQLAIGDKRSLSDWCALQLEASTKQQKKVAR